MLRTTGGYWDPVIWIIAFVVILLIAYIIRSFGRRDFSAKGDQTKPYFSGVAEESKEASHIRANNIYWGFLESLKSYYTAIMRIHTGIINDYVVWFVGVTALLFAIVFLVEVI